MIPPLRNGVGAAHCATSPAKEGRRGMRRIVLLLSSMVAALVLASGVGLLNAVKPAEATFPGLNGKIAFSSGQKNLHDQPRRDGQVPSYEGYTG
jgi:hypothetical protein